MDTIIEPIPEGLDARPAGVDVTLAELRKLILMQNARYTRLETRMIELARIGVAQSEKLDEVLERLPARSAPPT